jgi:excisionase family DNA binding protein
VTGRTIAVAEAIEKLNRYLSLNDAATYSTLSLPTLRRMVRERKLRAYHPSGRRVLIDRVELDEWIHRAAVGDESA